MLKDVERVGLMPSVPRGRGRGREGRRGRREGKKRIKKTPPPHISAREKGFLVLAGKPWALTAFPRCGSSAWSLHVNF